MESSDQGQQLSQYKVPVPYFESSPLQENHILAKHIGSI
jgi:hypothetical protein